MRGGTRASRRRTTPIAKDGKRRQFLLEIQPGTWAITGTGGSGAALGSADTSFSLGSYHFAAKAGEVLDLGVFEPQREETDNPDAKLTSGKLIGMMSCTSGSNPCRTG